MAAKLLRTSLAALLLSGTAIAAPVPEAEADAHAQSTGWDPCSANQETTTAVYSNGPASQVAGNPFVGGVYCNADSTTCQLSISEQYQIGSTVTVDTSFGVDIEDVISAGVSLSVSYSTSVAVGEGGTLTCAQGTYTCGLLITPQLASTPGSQTLQNTCSGSYDGGNYVAEIAMYDSENNALIDLDLCVCPNYPSSGDLPYSMCPANC